MTHAELWRAIDLHFAGRLDPRGEAVMREHLPGCTDCRARYRRHLLFERLARTGPAARERLARGLGLRVRPARWWVRPLVLATATVAVLLLVVRVRPHAMRDEAFRPRGARAPAGATWIYRLVDGHGPQIVGDRVAAGDELAFAYGNPGGKRFVTIFAVDEHGHVYWYYPAWQAGAAPPAGMVTAQAGPGPHELPEAVRHAFDGRRLNLVTVLSDQAVDVGAVDLTLRARADAPDREIAPPGAVVLRRTLEVRP